MAVAPHDKSKFNNKVDFNADPHLIYVKERLG